MKSFLVLSALLFALAIHAQEKIGPEQIQKVAARLRDATAGVKEPQLKIAADFEKADGLKASDGGIVAVPHKGLTAEKIAKAGAEIVPVGQLYLKGFAPALDGKPADNDRMHILMIDDQGQSHRVWLCLLGVQKRNDQLELVVFGSEKKPLLQVPLKKAKSTGEVPIEVSGAKEGEGAGRLTLNILGEYRASFVVMPPDA